jgi:excinuclease ABC subunit A
MAERDIIIRGAREHNLKGVDVTLPRDRLVVITGLSGSGKSSLAFDTLYAEGQRRYVESLSAYARQFLGLMQKPDLDSIEGLSPAISIEQKSTSKNPRSTVGTVTEIYDYLRLLYARIGTPHCPECGSAVEEQSAEQITNQLLSQHAKKQALILAPIVRQKKGTYEQLVKDLAEEGYSRVRVDGKIQRTDEKVKLERYVKHDIDAVQDRLVIGEDKQRLAEAIEHALARGSGAVKVSFDDGTEELYSSHNACPDCGIALEQLEPRMFSFNSPFGACATCHGLGQLTQFDRALVVPDESLSIAEGAIDAWSRRLDGWRISQLKRANKRIDMWKPFGKLPKSHQEYVLNGGEHWEGVLPMLDRLYKQTESERMRAKLDDYMVERPCPACKGRRLKDTVLAVTVGGLDIISLTDLAVADELAFFEGLNLTERQEFIAKQVKKEILERLSFLKNVGLDYLTLSRSAATLSGGEAQRIRLATQIGSNLMGVMYILDEPSIGLHQRDNQKLIDTLKGLRDVGNTVIVVEHDEDTIRQADHVVDLGPGAGRHGGRIVAQGPPSVVAKSDSLTGQYLSAKRFIPVPQQRREPSDWITVRGAKENNLRGIDVSIPTKVLCLVTGVSGSGKSTLINHTLHPALRKKVMKSKVVMGAHKSVNIPKDISKVIAIDQSPIGRTPRSNPATYTKLFDDIRKLFAQTKAARVRGYDQGRFSFNLKGGRCETCSGDGLIKIEMNFLPDIYVECEACKGKRYNSETLEVSYKGRNISEVLEMTVEEAHEFFENIPSIKRKLKTLEQVGLGYLHLGQPSTTLSGGEAQRIKLTRELAKRTSEHTVYILDEPTTGLHFEDVRRLLKVLQRLVDKGNSVVVIEHNLDVVKNADWIIDLGPEGGGGGGLIVAEGTPEEICEADDSHTGRFLKPLLANGTRKSHAEISGETVGETVKA